MSHGRYRLAAAAASVAFHVIILSVFAAVRLYPVAETNSPRTEQTAGIANIKNIVRNTPLVPKPRIKQTADKIIPPAAPLPFDSKTVILNETKQSRLARPYLSRHSAAKTDTAGEYRDLTTRTRNVEFFSCKSDCERVCYLVDCSGSMKGLLEQVKTELARSITELRPNQYFAIIFFGDNRLLTFAGNKLTRASQYEKDRALTFIDSVIASGKTNALAGFDLAVRIKNDFDLGPQVIMFLTDGFELAGSDAWQFRKQIMQMRKSSLPDSIVNTIGFWPGERDKNLLQSLTQSTGGQFICIETE